jgi:hypothetical protein
MNYRLTYLTPRSVELASFAYHHKHPSSPIGQSLIKNAKSKLKQIEECEISGFQGGEYEDDCLLRCCRSLAQTDRRFRGAY